MYTENINTPYPQLEALVDALRALGYNDAVIDRDEYATPDDDNTSIAATVADCSCYIWYIDTDGKAPYYELHVYNDITGDSDDKIYCQTPLQVLQRIAEFIG